MYKKMQFLSRSRYFPRKLQRSHILKEAADQHYDTIIDVGGGESKYKKILKYSNYISTDIEDRVGDGKVVIADANIKLPFDDEVADLIICTEVLEHLHTPATALAEMHRILKSGGKLVLTVPFVWPEHEAPADFYRYTQWGIVHLLTSAGFVQVKTINTNGIWTTLLTLFVSNLRSKLWFPIILPVNLLIILIYKFERSRTLPLGVHAIVYKK